MTSAAAPATCGVAMLVPLREAYDVSLVLYTERTFEPGATTSGFTRFAPVTGPRLEKLDIVSLLVVEPIVKALSNDAGWSKIVLHDEPSFLAAATNRMPPAPRLSIAV